jgi:Flp pilus assembly protein TadG
LTAGSLTLDNLYRGGLRAKLLSVKYHRPDHVSQVGQSVIEFTLLLPWLVFLFVGGFDWGYYAHALISTQSAARVAGIYGANLSGGTVSSNTVCTLALQELKIDPNVSGLTSCAGPVSSSQAVVTSAACTTVDSVNTIQVVVTYQTPQLIPIPGLLAGKMTLQRTAQLPMKNNSSCTVS